MRAFVLSAKYADCWIVKEHSFVETTEQARNTEDPGKPFDISLKSSFRLINVVIPAVAYKKETRIVYIVTAGEWLKNEGNLASTLSL